MSHQQQEIFDTRAAYQQAIDTVLSIAKKDICIFDSDISSLELDNRMRADAISSFLGGGRDRNLRVILHNLDYFNRHSPRLLGLLRRYSHCFSVRQTPESLRNMTDSFVLADGASGAIRFHADHYRGKMLLGQPVEVHDWQQRFESLWQESLQGDPPSPLGL